MGLLIALCCMMGLGGPWTRTARAQSGQLSLIRDAEVEDTIRLYATPLFEAARLDPDSIKIHIVDEDVINAFVAGGRHMFLFTGMLFESEDPNTVIGVIAHETGHIAGGHLSKLRGAYEDASAIAILSAVLGVAVGVLGGGGAGVMASGQGVAERNFYAFSRTQESSADQAGLSYLDATRQSARGLLALMEKLSESELLVSSSQDPYMLTHPLSRERIQAIQAFIDRSPWSDTPEPPELIERHHRMLAKLFGFLKEPRQTLIRYPESDQSVAARYARSIAYHKEHLDEQAYATIDGLIAEEPDNGYFWEVKGQFLFEDGRYDESVTALREATRLIPGQSLILQLLARVLTERAAPGDAAEAVEVLNLAMRTEDDDPSAWMLLGKAYALQENLPMADLASAEFAYLVGREEEARVKAERASQGLTSGTAEWLRAQDILAVTTPIEDDS
ncbi:MAG: M48 family metalloprotease [Proteobacteria bacterium]|nr:M48 family metalloprotease [Pseudomonadota bacterium]